MDKQPPRDQDRLTFSRTAVLIAIALAVGGGFFAAVYLFDQWYVRVNAIPEKKVLVSLDSENEDSPKPAETSSSGASSNLTFFENLTDRKTPYPTAPPAPSEPPIVVKPAPAQPSPSSPAKKTPTAPPPQKETTVVHEGSGAYTVQVGSFKHRSGAESLYNDLRKKGFQPSITPVRLSNGSTWYRVRVGAALLRSDAEALASKLQRQAKVKPIVVSNK